MGRLRRSSPPRSVISPIPLGSESTIIRGGNAKMLSVHIFSDVEFFFLEVQKSIIFLYFNILLYFSNYITNSV